MERHTLFEMLAKLLVYPDEGYHANVERCQRVVASAHPQAAQCIDRFAKWASGQPITDLEESFTRTFDLNPVCSLEVGWQLYGENYARGDFLVSMRQQMRHLAVDESTELPDHLTHVLPVFARLEEDQIETFANEILLPALDKMHAPLAKNHNPYADVLHAVQVLISQIAPRKEEVAHG